MNYIYNGTPAAGSEFSRVCELNQYKMLEQVQKFPKVAFYFACLISLAILIRFIIAPMIKKHDLLRENIKGISEMVMTISFPCLLYYMMFTTFHLTEEIYNKILEPILITICLSLIIYIIIRDWDRIINKFKNIKT